MNSLGLLMTTGKLLFPGASPLPLLRRLKLYFCVLTNLSKYKGLFNSSVSLSETIASRKDTIGVFVWPYVSKNWNLNKKIEIIESHHQYIDQVACLQIPPDAIRIISNLNLVHKGLELALERPKWFMREGELCLSLFLDGERIYTIAFTFSRTDQTLDVYIGGIQGRSIENITNVYSDLTKSLFGCRPRDFLVTSLQVLSGILRVDRIFGISDQCRHHRHRYFGNAGDLKNTSNYSEVWVERGGVLSSEDFYLLPLTYERNIQEIPVKKRGIYKKRYSMFAELHKSMSDSLGFTKK